MISWEGKMEWFYQKKNKRNDFMRRKKAKILLEVKNEWFCMKEKKQWFYYKGNIIMAFMRKKKLMILWQGEYRYMVFMKMNDFMRRKKEWFHERKKEMTLCQE